MAAVRVFNHVRFDAWEELNRVAQTHAGQWRPCVWQNYRSAVHVAPYCNALSNVETLHDLLLGGEWCDDVELRAELRDDPDAEMLFRFYGLVLLAWDQTEMDLRQIRSTDLARTAGSPRRTR